MHPLAVITMTFNEHRKLPYWLGHYAAEVGLEHCTVIDHGSSDGSTDRLHGANHLRLPRSPQDNDRRTAMIADIAAGLLHHYAHVAYVDVDELLVANPAHHASLAAYAAGVDTDAVTAIGVEIVHAADEAQLDGRSGIGVQRGYGLFSSSMCKTSIIGRRVRWAPGFHAHDGRPRFDDLYLFHLRHADLEEALERLEITRAMAWRHDDAGRHQRGSREAMIDLVRRFGGRPVGSFDSLAVNCADFLGTAQPGSEPGGPFVVPLAVYGTERLPLPPAFRTALSRAPLA